MDKKYELLKDDCINYCGKTLYRIKALKEFGDVKKGELGGYIESKSNLSQRGNCWVFDNAKVYDNARVYDNAEVFEEAKVFGSARIYDNAAIFGRAEVYGNAQIHGNAEVCGYAWIFYNANVYGNALIYGNAEVFGSARIQEGNIIGIVSIPYKDIFQYQCKNRMLTAILTEDDEILYSIGCQLKITEEEFIDRIHNKDGGLKENPHRAEYLKLIPLINLYFGGE